MRNILLFLIHFAIISDLKNCHGIVSHLSQGRLRKVAGFIQNFTLNTNTFISHKLVDKSQKIGLKGSEGVESGVNKGVLLESSNVGLKSIVDKGSIKSSPIRHEILDKESLLDELIVTGDNLSSVFDSGDQFGKNLGVKSGKVEEVLSEFESSVLKKSVDKREVISPADKSLKRRSKDTIYTRLQNYVKSCEPFLAKFGILDEVKNFVHLLHWNAWHTLRDGIRECNWTEDQFSRFGKLIEGIDQIINQQLSVLVSSVSNTQVDIIAGLVEERSRTLFSAHYMYNKLSEIVQLGEFDIYKQRMANLHFLRSRAISTFKPLFSRFSVVLRKLKAVIDKLCGIVWKRGERAEEEVCYDKVDLAHLLRYLSHSHVSAQSLRNLHSVKRSDLYRNSDHGKWCLYFVGSGSRQPTSSRLTSTMAFRRGQREGPIWLFDCGEGSKNAMEKMGLDPLSVECIFLTHLHGDHCYGLFSFLYLRERGKPLEIYGPPGTKRLINAVHQSTSTMTATQTLFNVHEIIPTKPPASGGSDVYVDRDESWRILEEDGIEVLGANLEHTMPTVGYVIREREPSGRKIAICQDSSDSGKMKGIAKDADLLVHEATLGSCTPLVSGILLDLFDSNSGLILAKGSIPGLCKFLSSIETKLCCFNFTLSALSSFVKCERYYMMNKLTLLKNFISNFKPFNPFDTINQVDRVDSVNSVNTVDSVNKSRKELEKELKERWLSSVFGFMDRLNALNELSSCQFFSNRLQARYNLMQKLSTVMPTLDLYKVIETSSKKILFSDIVPNHNLINKAYEKFNIRNLYSEKYTVNVLKYLNSITSDLFNYWNEILQLDQGDLQDPNPHVNWRRLHNRIIASFGHSTPDMAGKFASEIRAKRLVLTHFSNKYSGDEKLQNLLTMIRLENEASKNGIKNIPIVAAWDKMVVKV